MILQAMTGDRGLSGSLAQQEQIVMKTVSIWIATLVLGVGVAASATQASVTQDTPAQASITQAGSVVGQQRATSADIDTHHAVGDADGIRRHRLIRRQ